jgi:hypothetical protein
MILPCIETTNIVSKNISAEVVIESIFEAGSILNFIKLNFKTAFLLYT